MGLQKPEIVRLWLVDPPIITYITVENVLLIFTHFCIAAQFKIQTQHLWFLRQK